MLVFVNDEHGNAKCIFDVLQMHVICMFMHNVRANMQACKQVTCIQATCNQRTSSLEAMVWPENDSVLFESWYPIRDTLEVWYVRTYESGWEQWEKRPEL